MADFAFTLLAILSPSSPCFDVEQNDLNSQQLPDQLLFVTNCMKETFRFIHLQHNYFTQSKRQSQGIAMSDQAWVKYFEAATT